MNRWLRLGVQFAVGSLFVSALVGGTSLLHRRAEGGAAVSAGTARAQAVPVPVRTLTLTRAVGYTVADRHVGRLEPARQARLSFERAGRIARMLVDEGDVVAAGQPLAELERAALQAERDRLVGQRAQLSAQVELARLTEQRQRSLRQDGHVSAQRLDEARLSTASLLGEMEALEASIRAIDIEIGKTVLTAPFAGTVGARLVDEGAVATSGTAVLDLLETGRPQVRIGVPATLMAGDLAPGMTVTVDIAGRSVSARVASVRPDLSPITRTVSILIDVPAIPGITFGDTVALTLSRAVRTPGFWLPVSALSEGQRGLWSVLSLVEGEGGTLVAREAVEVLHVDDERAFVRGSLRDGQRIVASGRNRLVPGQRVTALTAEIPG